ncbi:MAG: hypothetical protein OWQ57_10595 [Sulfobacillus sp.]|nr:hypothetical protein [Sulfobacillus sp.]
MSSSEVTCQELCTATATPVVTPVKVTGVCDYAVSTPLGQVTVSDCQIESVSSLAISSTTVLISVQTVVHFTFVLDDTHQTAECRTVIEFLLSPVEPPVTLLEFPPCLADVTCRTTYAGYDRFIDAEEFLVTVIGSVSCYGCESTVVNVQLCPPTM